MDARIDNVYISTRYLFVYLICMFMYHVQFIQIYINIFQGGKPNSSTLYFVAWEPLFYNKAKQNDFLPSTGIIRFSRDLVRLHLCLWHLSFTVIKFLMLRSDKKCQKPNCRITAYMWSSMRSHMRIFRDVPSILNVKKLWVQVEEHLFL